jgi:hypothetical protein
MTWVDIIRLASTGIMVAAMAFVTVLLRRQARIVRQVAEDVRQARLLTAAGLLANMGREERDAIMQDIRDRRGNAAH